MEVINKFIKSRIGKYEGFIYVVGNCIFKGGFVIMFINRVEFY